VLVVCWGRRIWLALLASSFVVHLLLNGAFVSQSVLFMAADLTEILVASMVLSWRCSWQLGFYSIRQLHRVLFAGVVAPLLSAPLLVWGLGFLPGAHSSFLDFLSSSSIFWMRSATGFFALAPALLVWIKRPPFFLGPSKRESVGVSFAVATLCVFAFTAWLAPAPHPFWFALLPVVVLFWSAARCGIFLTTHLVVVILAAASLAALSEGPLFQEAVYNGQTSSTWIILNLFALCAMSLAVISTRVTIKAEDEKTARDRLHSIAEILPQMVCYYDASLVRRYTNTAYQRAFGGIENLQPMALQDLVTPAVLEQSLPHCQAALRGETVRFLEKIELADGQLHSIDRVLTPDLSPKGNTCGFFSVATDITEYLQAQEERRALETQILQTQKLESLSKLAGRLAHEFNNRLCGMMGHADIAKYVLPEAHEALPALRKVIEIGKEAADLCGQMFAFSGHGSGHKVPVNMGAMIAEMTRLIELSLPQGVRLHTNFAPDLPKVLIDEAQFRQALLNLVQNAAEASQTPPCEMQIRVHAEPRGTLEFQESFLLSKDAKQMLVAITVHDDGEGITPAVMPRIFEPFFTTRSGLRGLGLAGVLGITHGHGGALLVHSEKGKGTDISIYLPAVAERLSAKTQVLLELSQ